jgi:hypothetical protein
VHLIGTAGHLLAMPIHLSSSKMSFCVISWARYYKSNAYYTLGTALRRGRSLQTARICLCALCCNSTVSAIGRKFATRTQSDPSCTQTFSCAQHPVLISPKTCRVVLEVRDADTHLGVRHYVTAESNCRPRSPHLDTQN